MDFVISINFFRKGTVPIYQQTLVVENGVVREVLDDEVRDTQLIALSYIQQIVRLLKLSTGDKEEMDFVDMRLNGMRFLINDMNVLGNKIRSLIVVKNLVKVEPSSLRGYLSYIKGAFLVNFSNELKEIWNGDVGVYDSFRDECVKITSDIFQ
jgi:hypothetical protein